MKELASKCTELKVDLLWDWKIYCLQACVCTFQPRNCTGLGNEGVNSDALCHTDLEFFAYSKHGV